MIRCFECWDYSANRPKDKPCKCGESWAPESIAIDLDDRGTSSLAAYSELRGEPDGGGHEARLTPQSPRYVGIYEVMT